MHITSQLFLKIIIFKATFIPASLVPRSADPQLIGTLIKQIPSLLVNSKEMAVQYPN